MPQTVDAIARKVYVSCTGIDDWDDAEACPRYVKDDMRLLARELIDMVKQDELLERIRRLEKDKEQLKRTLKKMRGEV